MNEPVFLKPEQVEKLHHRSLELFGGSDGIRDRNLFDGAVNQAQNIYWYAFMVIYLISLVLIVFILLRLSLMGTREQQLLQD